MDLFIYLNTLYDILSEKESEMFKKGWHEWIAAIEDWVSNKEYSAQSLRRDLEKLKSRGKDALNSVGPEMKHQAVQWFSGHIGYSTKS